jgi:hypothetical protein
MRVALMRTNGEGDDVVIVAIARPAELVVAQAVLKKNNTEISIIFERPVGDFRADALLVTAEEVRRAQVAPGASRLTALVGTAQRRAHWAEGHDGAPLRPFLLRVRSDRVGQGRGQRPGAQRGRQ